MEFARANADYPDAFAPNEQIVQRASDHDGFVLYLSPSQPNALTSTLLDTKIRLYPNPVRAGERIFLEFSRDVRAHVGLVTINGRILSQTLKQKGNQHVNIRVEHPGLYTLFIQTNEGFRSEKIVVLPND
jgi:hypothetical protein